MGAFPFPVAFADFTLFPGEEFCPPMTLYWIAPDPQTVAVAVAVAVAVVGAGASAGAGAGAGAAAVFFPIILRNPRRFFLRILLPSACANSSIVT